ncbi:LysR substrate-binding domain-containing protein [Thalassobius sp. S69A]|uniref:LysR family transcriptional regulator n=1 Tax=unclassified Thalassovita TaxID=2619711 RepID=UPI000C0E3E00|nr:LysR family transcriptional regulator [Paracoccaceae bacterium]MBT25477.1 LysR family transcriptional regulator [Paracoccaceae bacterium]
MDIIDGIRAFVATAQTGSFTGGAERLGISNRLTSKYVAELETRLGTRLLQRTTRRVGLTAAGEDLLARAPALLDDLDAMLGAVTDEARGFTGALRISAPVTLGEAYVADLLHRFAAPHPELVIDLRLSDSYADLAREGIDLAFRVGDPGMSTLRVRRLGVIRSHLVAAPAYLQQHPAPRRPVDLAAHSCILDTNRRDPGRWTFERDGQAQHVSVAGRYQVNSARVARDLAVQGLGLAYCPAFVLDHALETGALRPVLKEYTNVTIPFGAAYLENRTLPRKVRALIDFAAADAKQLFR